MGMYLFIKTDIPELVQFYNEKSQEYSPNQANHSNGWQTILPSDSGLDIPLPYDITIPKNSLGFKIPLGIKCQPHVTKLDQTKYIPGNIIEMSPQHSIEYINIHASGYYLFPRSSTGSKTPIRLSNQTGIIDYGYRGEITACVDNMSNKDYKAVKGQRLFQICSPDLRPIQVYVTNNLTITSRNEAGYGSTGI